MLKFTPNPALNGIVIILIFGLLAWIVQHLFAFIIRRFTKRTPTEIDDQILSTLQKPVYITVILLGVYLSMDGLLAGDQAMSTIKNILVTLLFIIWAYALSSVSGLVLEDFKDKLETDRQAKIDSDVIPFIENLIKAGLFALAILMALDLWGVDITPVLASAGVAGVAVAFAAKDTVSNLFGGVSIFMDRPYRVGDYVYIDNQYRGEVIDIGMRSTKIRTRDNILITVPNSVMVTQSVVNETGYDPKMRLRIPLGVTYDSDLENVEYVLKGIAKEHQGILDDPHPRVRYREFAESAINLEFLVFIKYPAEKGKITHDLIKSIKKAFQEENITIPYPHRRVLLENEQ